MKTIQHQFILLIVSVLFSPSVFTQAVVVSDTANAVADGSAIFEVQSEQKGFLPPKMTTAQRNAITAPAEGLIIYDLDLQSLLVYNGTEWIDAKTGTLDDAYDFGGPGAGSLINADSGPVQISGDGGFVVSTSSATGSIPATGSDVRMMWYPGKYAFRAGYPANSLLWNDANIGSGSVATGRNTLASGDYSTALGHSAEATGDFSFAQGSYTEANGKYSAAVGRFAAAGGDISAALGAYTNAPSFAELAVGTFNTSYTPSSPTSFVATDRLFVVGNGQSKSNTSDALTILKNGNTGIGTSAPQSTLHIDGSFRLENGTEAAGRLLTSDTDGNATWTDPEGEPENIIVVDGSGNGDYTTITGALNSVTPAPGNPVIIYIRPGIYYENIELKSYTTLEGASSGSVRILGNITDVVTMDTLTGVRLKSLTIGSDGGVATNGITVYNTDAVLEDLEILGDWTNGINTMDQGIQAYNSNLRIKDSRVAEHENHGILLDSTEAIITNSEFSASVSGLDVRAGSRLGLYESTVESGLYAVYVYLNAKADLQGNLIDQSRIYTLGKLTMNGNLVKDTPSGYALNNAGSSVITGNIFLDCADQAIYENSRSGTTISGNVIDNCGSSGDPAVTVYNSDAVISGNTFRNNFNGDMQVTDFADPWLVGNDGDLNLNTDSHIIMAGADDLRLERHGDDLAMVLPSGGNFGIGLTDPTALLHLKDGNQELEISPTEIFKPDANLMTIKSANGMALESSLGMTLDATADIDLTSGLNATISAASITEISGSSQVNINSQLYAVTGFGVAVNSTNTSGFDFAVNGTAAKLGGGSWSVYSDARLKHSVEPLPQGTLDRLLKLQGYTFEYKQEAIENNLALPGRQTGLIAQEVREIFPEWVDTNDEGFLFVTERGVTALFVEAMRELRAEKDAEIGELNRKIDQLSQRLEELEGVIYSVTGRE